jgi:hypothetical protein
VVSEASERMHYVLLLPLAMSIQFRQRYHVRFCFLDFRICIIKFILEKSQLYEGTMGCG